MKWIFKNGTATQEFASFPYAFRTMFAIVKKGVETGKKFNEMTSQMSIVSPLKDITTGKDKVYTYAMASKFAEATGLLTSDGQIEAREFKRKY
jgi:hypothetical protein